MNESKNKVISSASIETIYDDYNARKRSADRCLLLKNGEPSLHLCPIVLETPPTTAEWLQLSLSGINSQYY